VATEYAVDQYGAYPIEHETAKTIVPGRGTQEGGMSDGAAIAGTPRAPQPTWRYCTERVTSPRHINANGGR
jgi:hypothetical protein